ncbi:hypothetical protein [Mycobacterium riyadhense]|uniref:hypothetical protein n=1 Tax=Mycobacterium riyadhense TaxID=486698 RepID=UPI00195CB1F6|nr:hypothetical protein [Mycobacterium riyadhense]
MVRLDVPDGPGGEAALIWTLRPAMHAQRRRLARCGRQRIGTDFRPATRPPVETTTYWNAWEQPVGEN